MDIMLPDLPGFDTVAALKLLNNNAKLYGSVLKRFKAQYVAAYADLAQTMRGSDWDKIQREAHTIKGLAGTIGHPLLQQAALDLEMYIKNAASPADIVPDAVAARAGEFLDALAGVLAILKDAYPE